MATLVEKHVQNQNGSISSTQILLEENCPEPLGVVLVEGINFNANVIHSSTSTIIEFSSASYGGFVYQVEEGGRRNPLWLKSSDSTENIIIHRKPNSKSILGNFSK